VHSKYLIQLFEFYLVVMPDIIIYGYTEFYHVILTTVQQLSYHGFNAKIDWVTTSQKFQYLNG